MLAIKKFKGTPLRRIPATGDRFVNNMIGFWDRDYTLEQMMSAYSSDVHHKIKYAYSMMDKLEAKLPEYLAKAEEIKAKTKRLRDAKVIC